MGVARLGLPLLGAAELSRFFGDHGGPLFSNAGLRSGQTTTPKTYTLRLYTVSGTAATLISTYVTDNTLGFTDGTWLRYSGMTNTLQPNTVYAYTHKQNGAGWDQLAAVLGDLYAGGQACLIPAAGGVITFGTSTTLDATFQVSMVPNGFPAIQNVTISPVNSGVNPVYVPTPVTLTVQASGASPLVYRWQTDNGLGGAFSNIPSSNTNSYTFATTGMTAGTYLYQVIVTNVNNTATSSPVTLNLAAPSAPVIVADTTINPSATFVGGGVLMGATFNGSMPISYRWMFNNGSGAVAIAGATNATHTIASAQIANSGSYLVTASNAIAPFTISSTAVSLLVGTAPQNNTGSAGILDATATAPTAGPNDIAQLSTTPVSTVPGINYYVNNGAPPGQTFTTLGTSPGGYKLSSIYMQEETLTDGSGGLATANYTLGIYSVSGNNAVLITSYASTNAPTIIDWNWIQWVGLTNVLAANSTYAFSIHKDNGTGWWKLANNSTATDLYAAGQAALLPAGGAGVMAFSSDATIDAGFLVALAPNSNAPTLAYTKTGNTLGFTVPSGFKLQAQTNSLATGLTSAWSDYPGGAAGAVNVTINPAKATVFFRLSSTP